MQVWITKHAVTRKKIRMIDVHSVAVGDRFVVERPGNKGNFLCYKIGTDVFFTEAEAIANATDKRDRRIAALRRQIEVLERLKF